MMEIEAKYEFTRIEYCNEPGFEMDIFFCPLIPNMIHSERGCIISALRDYGVEVEDSVLQIMSDTDLDRLCLDNNIYVCFLDDKGE